MRGLLGPGLVAASSSDDESHLAPLAETGIPGEEELEDLAFDQDLYGFAIHALVRDTHPVSVGDKGTKWLRFYRLLLALGTLFFSISVQLFLIYETKAFLTSKAVHDIRVVYNEFQMHMYGDDPSHMEVDVDGHQRGKPEFFRPELFESLAPEQQAQACRISLSQPWFLGLVLFIWTLTCAGEIKTVGELYQNLILRLPRASRTSMQLAVVSDHPDAEEEYQKVMKQFYEVGFSELQASGLCNIVLEQRSRARKRDREKVVLISALTPCMKAFMCLFVLLPRFALSCTLLWLGSRWLTATNNFDELLLNAVALQFILALKDLLFHVCISARGKCDLAKTRIRQPARLHAPGCCIFMGAFLWGVSSMAWAALYIYQLQQVLPAYRWDVHGVCQTHIKEHYSD